MAEPTSVLTFNDLIREVAYKLGLASYGADGDLEPQIPTNTHDLILCKRIVNKAISMFINDGPQPNGWRWLSQIAQVDLWPQISPDLSGLIYVTGTYSGGTGLTTITLHQPASGTLSFYPSMELHRIWLKGQPDPATPGWSQPISVSVGTIGTPFTVVSYLTATTMTLKGDATATIGTGCSYSFASTGDYTLPQNFSGQYDGQITYVANTNRGMTLHWIDEASIRQRRQNYNVESGTPYEAAIRQIPKPSLDLLTYAPPRQRWELMTWRIASEYLHVIFPYTLYFDSLVNLTDVSPAPFSHDETLKAACLAVAEKEVEDAINGPDWTYYRGTCLPNSYRIDAASAPKSLGYFGNPSAYSRGMGIRQFRDNFYQRPTVPFNQ